MYGLYSVKLLFESSYLPNTSSEKVFEERIIIARAACREDIHAVVQQKFPPVRYENGEGGITTNTLVKVLDIFELVENLEKSLEFTEVYSRHLVVDQSVGVDEVISSYSLDK